MQNSDYRSRFGISQSAIKDFRFKHPKKWKEMWIDGEPDLKKNEEDFIFGSLVDTILFSPDLLDQRFFVTKSNNIPKGAMRQIVKALYAHVGRAQARVTVLQDETLPEDIEQVSYDITDYRDQILACCKEYVNKEGETGWNNGWKDATRIDKVISEGKDYFDLLVKAGGREVISAEMNLEAMQTVRVLQNHQDFKQYFGKMPQIANLYQLEIFDDISVTPELTVPFKCAVDILHIDHEFRTITVVDFKTSFSAHNFLESIKKFGYCDQVSFYQFMVERWIQKPHVITEHGDLRAYRFKEPMNVVIDREMKIPYAYEYDWRDIEIAREGNEKFLSELYDTHEHLSRIKKGWWHWAQQIAWHLDTKQWDYPVEHYRTKKIKVNLVNS